MTQILMTQNSAARRPAATQGTRLRFDRGRFSLSQADALDEKPATTLFGLPLVNAALEEAAEAIVARAARGDRTIIHFINAHCINTLRTDPGYGPALARADALLPDGSGLRIASFLSGRPLGENLNGTDLFPWLCREAAAQDVPVFLLGGQPGIARKAAKVMVERCPGLTIAGAHHGYVGTEADEDLIAAINASGAGILLVGMGVPHQEKWIARHRDRINVPVLMGVGGLFDYYSGSIPRAPKMVRAIGMEWVWRLAQEPRRLARRYLLGNTAFLARAAVQAWYDRGKAEQYAAASKRSLDLGIALLALILLGPLLAALCVFIMLDDRGPVLFSQTRIGADGKPFRMHKFRSMAVDAEARLAAIRAQSERDGVCFKMKQDPRITRVGRWLRRLSLDELPQLFNVVKGDMSIVGPRPALPNEVLAYDDDVRGRLRGAPGLTCTWQVSGRAEIPFEEQARLDIDYLESRTLVTDLKLIAQTVPAVISGRGAY
jgi:exopolysaccharide biosynthesis WecB/TagA/CpsF family protein